MAKLKSAAAVSAAVVTFAATACSGSAPASDISPDPTPSATVMAESPEAIEGSTPVTQPTGPASVSEGVTGDVSGFSLVGQINIADVEGYKYVLTYRANASGFQQDPANAKPGFTNVLQSAQLEAAVQNTTTGRNAPGDGFQFNIWGVYPLTSIVCTSEQTPVSDIQGGGFRTLVGAGQSPEYCAVQLTADLYSYESSIPDQGMIQLQSNTGGPLTQRVEGVPEADAPAVIDALNQPLYKIALVANGNPNQRPDVQTTMKIDQSCPLILFLNGGTSKTVITAVPLSGGTEICQS